MPFQAFVRWLLPRETHFYENLERQATLCNEAATALLLLFPPASLPLVEVKEKISALEHLADVQVLKMEEALAKTFVTPLDREDLRQLSGQLEDVTDLMNLAIRTSHLYGLEAPFREMQALSETLTKATALLCEGVGCLRKHEYGALLEINRQARQHEKAADTIFRQAVSELFANEKIGFKELLKKKEILEGLENAIDACDGAAETLSSIAVKHG
ncbi:MAG: DUF47 family protein [Cystobacterineae bacterium]|nr:DUF47 family protein [Cystobacterineae bacterium]